MKHLFFTLFLAIFSATSTQAVEMPYVDTGVIPAKKMEFEKTAASATQLLSAKQAELASTLQPPKPAEVPLADRPVFDGNTVHNHRQKLSRDPATLKQFLHSELLLENLFQNRLIDAEFSKSTTLEYVFQQKIRKIISTYAIRDDQFRSNVLIHFSKLEPDRTISQAIVGQTEQNATLTNGEPSADDRIRHDYIDPKNLAIAKNIISEFRDEHPDDAYEIGDYETSDSSQPEAFLKREKQTSLADISSIHLHLAISNEVQKPQADAAVDAIQKSFESLFGNRLKVHFQQADLTPIIPTLRTQATTFMAENLWFSLIAVILFAAGTAWLIRNFYTFAIATFISLRTVRRERAAHQLALARTQAEAKEKLKVEQELIEKERVKAEEEKVKLETLAKEKLEAEELDKLKVVSDGIVQFIKTQSLLVLDLTQQWAESESHHEKVASIVSVLLENDLKLEGLNLRTELVEKFKVLASDIAQKPVSERLTQLSETYKTLSAFRALKNNLQNNPFSQLNSINDHNLSRVLATFPIEVQATLLTNISESRASFLLAQMGSSHRSKILGEIAKGKIASKTEIQEAMNTIKREAEESVKDGLTLPSDETSIENLVPLLSRMQFEVQFQTAKNFLNYPKEVRSRILSSFFNVAFLPQVKEDFLSELFTDQDSEWIKSVIHPFGELFRKKVEQMLPPMQATMIQGGVPPTQSASMKALEELNQKINDRIAARELTRSAIFDLTENENEQSNQAQSIAA